MLWPPIDPTTGQVQVYLLHSSYTSNPDVLAAFSSPCIAHGREVGLDFDQQLSSRVQDVNSIADTDQDVAVVSDTQSIG